MVFEIWVKSFVVHLFNFMGLKVWWFLIVENWLIKSSTHLEKKSILKKYDCTFFEDSKMGLLWHHCEKKPFKNTSTAYKTHINNSFRKSMK